MTIPPLRYWGRLHRGDYDNEAGLDVNTAARWGPYTFQIFFSLDLSDFAKVDSAIVEGRHGSVGRRTSFNAGSSPGYGNAPVRARFNDTLKSFGPLADTPTGVAGSPAEETVRTGSFDVTNI